MPIERLEGLLASELARLSAEGRRKGEEPVTVAVLPARGGGGPRVRLAGHGDREFLRMNSNGYLGLARRAELVSAAERATRDFGVGPAAVRFISGTHAPHVALESSLAAFHGREAAMVWSSAYAAVMGVLPPLVDASTAVISDELNHNCIINAIRLARPAERHVVPHLDLPALESALETAARGCARAIVVTDGVFSMRGDHAPLAEIAALVRAADARFAQNAILVVDDSHGVGAFGRSGRGSEEVTRARADVLIATLGKAFGSNGGYLVGSRVLVDYLRETSPFYVFSNPIGPGEAAAAQAALALVDGAEGRRMLAHLREMTRRLRDGIGSLGYETLPGEHPVVPLLVRDSARTRDLVAHLRESGVLATGLTFPVVPRREEEIRFQVCADHTPADLDAVLDALSRWPGRP